MTEQLKKDMMFIASRQKLMQQMAIDTRGREMYKMSRRAEKKSWNRRRYLESEEEEMYANMLKAKEEEVRKKSRLEREQKLAQVMAELKRQEMVEKKTDHLIHNNCLELRQVEKQLRTAYAKKELMCQIEEKKAARREETVKDYFDGLKLIEVGNKEQKTEAEKEVRKNELLLEHKRALEEQIRETKDRRETSPPTSGPVDFGPSGYDRGRTKRSVKGNYTREEIEEWIKIKNELKENERREADAMDERIKEYWTNVDTRTRRRDEMHEKTLEEKQRIYNGLVDNIISKTTDRWERIELQTLLAQEEERRAVRMAERGMAESKKALQNEMRRQNDMQLKIKKDNETKKEQNDLVFEEKNLQNIRDYNEAESKKKSERLRKMVEYGKDLKRTIDERNDAKTKERTLKKNEYSDHVKLEESRLAEIKKKQMTFVGQHLENLKGFFPLNSKGLCVTQHSNSQ